MSDEPMGEYVNRPNRFLSMGARAWGETIRDFAAGWEILWRLTRRDIASRYRQSLLGLGWAILTPLAMMFVFVYLEHANVVAAGDTGVPYPLFLYSGLLPWQLFQACLQRTTISLVANTGLVTRVRLPREILVLSAIGGALFDFLLGLLVLAGFFWWFGTTPAWTFVFLPILLFFQLVLAFALGLILAVVNGAMRDLGSMVPLAMLLWMFLTPVVYPKGSPWLDWVNPMTPFLVSCRDLAFHGHLSMPGPLAVACAFSLVLLPLSWRMFHIMLPRIAETV